MDFSESYKASTGPTPCYSPDGRFLATTVEYRLILREAETLRIVQLYSCLDRIHHVQWSPNSLYVLCGLYSRGIVQVWSVDQPEWACKIDEGPAGVGHAMWTPDGLGILLLAQFQVRTTIWSLMDRRCTYLRGPKHQDRGCAFSPDGATLALLERYECRDHVTLYDAQSGWRQAAHAATETLDAQDVAWAPGGSYLAVWDSCLNYGVCLLDRQGRRLATYHAYDDALGVRSVAWSPSGTLLAVGSYDQVARLLNHVTWQPLMECRHPAKVAEPDAVVVYREVPEGPTPRGSPAAAAAMAHRTPTKSAASPALALTSKQTRYLVDVLPAHVPSTTPAMDEPNPRLGVAHARWSPDSQFLATQNENMPGAVWVWDMATMELCAVLNHLADVLDVQWAPHGCTLAAVAASGKVHLWTPAGASIVHIPLKNFSARKIVWNPRGGSLCLLDREAFCCAFVAAA